MVSVKAATLQRAATRRDRRRQAAAVGAIPPTCLNCFRAPLSAAGAVAKALAAPRRLSCDLLPQAIVRQPSVGARGASDPLGPGGSSVGAPSAPAAACWLHSSLAADRRKARLIVMRR